MNDLNRLPDSWQELVLECINSLSTTANLSEKHYRIVCDSILNNGSFIQFIAENMQEVAVESYIKSWVESFIEGFINGTRESIIRIALLMKKDGISYEKIAKYTGLSFESIDALK